MREELKPCPFCGGVAERGEDVLDGEAIFFVICRSCAARGGASLVRERAPQWWNNRKHTTKLRNYRPPSFSIDDDKEAS